MKLPPVDDACQIPALFSFRRELLLAAARRDWAFFEVNLSEIVQVWPDEAGSATQCRARYRPLADEGRFWTLVTELLTLGGVLRGNGWFVAPYLAETFDQGFNVLFHDVVVVAPTMLRAEPDERAIALRDVAYEIVEPFPVPRSPAGGDVDGWSQVRTTDGLVGWLPSRSHRSPIDYLMTLGPTGAGGRWQITGLYTETMA